MYRVEDSYWWYRGMRAFARRFVPELFPLAAGVRLLDAGCGTGANLAHVRDAGSDLTRVVGLDCSLTALGFCARRGLRLLVLGSAEALPFREEVFDAVTCHDLLYTLPHDDVALAEIFRVARNGALLYVTAAAFDWLKGEQDAATHGLRRYTDPGMRTKVSRAGFRVERSSYANTLMVLPVFLIRRLRATLAPASKQTDAVSEFHLAPGVVNGLLTALLSFEAAVASRVRLPVGSTLVMRARKETPEGAGLLRAAGRRERGWRHRCGHP